MDETKATRHTSQEERDDQEEQESGQGSMEHRQQQAVDMGSTTITTQNGTIHTLTIVGQVEGHQLLPSNSKSTKYEHVPPLLTAVEESEDIDGLSLIHI